MAKSKRSDNYMVWMDCEMTGLDPAHNVLLEIATIVTDYDLNIIARGPDLAIRRSEARLNAMDAWNRRTHKKSGLIEKVRASKMSEAEAERAALEFLGEHVPASASPMCGNSICQDRRFLARWMPRLEAHFHYRNLDVSTLKELVRRWKPELAKGFSKEGKHEALADILESIEELKFYRKAAMTI